MKAITTKYLGATDTRPSRIVATAEPHHRLVIPYDSVTLGGQDAHAEAAKQLALKLRWPGNWVAGSIKDGYVFVPLEAHNTYRIADPFVYTSMNDVIEANRLIGKHFFDRDIMTVFRRRIESRLIAGKRFITSERAPSQDRKRYTIREARPDGTIATIGNFQEYATLAQAKKDILRQE